MTRRRHRHRAAGDAIGDFGRGLGESAQERSAVVRSRLIGYLPLIPRAHLREQRPLYWFRRGTESVRHKFTRQTRQKRLRFLLGCGKPRWMAALWRDEAGA